MEVKFGKICDLRGTSSKKCKKVEVILGVNGVAMGRYGLIFNQDGATGSRKVSRYLPDLQDTMKNSKLARRTDN